ncbi:hypothetical protein [Streptomyces sp. NPDC056144]|uniref:hypothetical protein n=1 Tax=unclassified Streptomyces TaxID=2593676 RepID=UPI0035DE54C1
MTTQNPSPQSRPRPEKMPEDRRHMIRRRWLTAVTIVLLVGIPAGYLVISAGQSRDSGRMKEQEASASGLQTNRPSGMKRRIFEVPVPWDAWAVKYYETSNWKTSRFYAEFTTDAVGLDVFLEESGTSRSALTPGLNPIGEKAVEITGWKFAEGATWQGVTVNREKPRPTTDIAVDMTDPAFPKVYAVSTTTP